MKNVGILVYDVSLTGGAEKVAINLAKELSKSYNVYLISLFDEETFKYTGKYEFHYIEKEPKSISMNLISLSKKLRNYIQKEEIDVMLNITAGVNTVSLLATMNLKTKTVYCEHSNLYNQTYGKKHIFRQWLGAKYCDYVVALTKADKDEFIRRYHIKDKCEYIYNWYNAVEHVSCYASDSKSIISVGRLEKVKGYDRLIDVAKKVLPLNPDWKWDIYGDGTLRSILQEEIKRNNLTEQMFLKGNANNLQDLYPQYAFCVLTSYYEGLPLALLEAQSSNLPIVSFDCKTGPSEIITNNENGFLVENGNIDEMAKKINMLIDDEEKRVEFSNNAQQDIYKFDKKLITEKWISLIERVS